MLLDWVKSSADWLVAVVAGLAALAAISRFVLKRARRFAAKWDNAREVLVGREEIRHPDSGRVLVPETPGLGKRLANIEDTLIALGDTRDELRELGDTRSELHELGQRVGELTEQFGQHITEANDLELARTHEREEMWQAIRAVATPQPWDGAERREPA